MMQEYQMPKYEYKCKKCGKKFEIAKPVEEWNRRQKCPECNSKETKKLVSPFIPKTSDKS
jgi:putative FmdB family regulatory protein